ncbi:hypothetical protein TNCV_3204531 [Trichonephila clavipes]|nr:hypothetical protein TNCV_3204531 [Trichonephila clavipes]
MSPLKILVEELMLVKSAKAHNDQGGMSLMWAMGRFKAWDNGARASSRPQLGLETIIIRILSKVKCYFLLYSPNNWEFWTICQLATCDDRHPRASLGLPPYTIITHSVR